MTSTMSANESAAQTTASTIYASPGNGGFSIIQTLNAFLLFVSVWILGCMIIYGTKTRRWTTRPGASSLNSGAVYVSCTIVVGLSIPQILTSILFTLPSGIPDGDLWCETLADVFNACYAAFTYGSYFYLWILQRRIYTHPYVKERVSKAADWFSRLVIVIVTLLSVVLLIFYVFPSTYMYEKARLACQFRKPETNYILAHGKEGLLLALFVLISVTMIALCTYPAIRVELGTVISDSDSPADKPARSRHSCLWWIFCCIGRSKEYSISPIQLVVRRTVLSCIMIVIFHFIPVVLVSYVIPNRIRPGPDFVVYSAASPVIILCMLATFGFANKILLLCVPTFWKKDARRRSNRVVDENAV